MASTKVKVHVTEHVTTPSLVTSTANITTSCFPHTSVIFSPQHRGPQTRSSTGSTVKSTHMKFKLSPSNKTPQVTETDTSNPSAKPQIPLPSVPNIINLNNVDDVYAWIEAGGVYVGREIDNGTFKHEGSRWGNPHTIREHKSRKKVVKMFRESITKNDELMKDIGELKGKVLGCFCSPEQCHAEVLHELAGNIPVYEETVPIASTPEKVLASDTSNRSPPFISSTTPQSAQLVPTIVTKNGDVTPKNEAPKSTHSPPPSPSISSNLPTYDLNLIFDAVNSLQADNLLQQERILKLEKRISSLEGTLIQNNARLTVRDHVVEALKGEVNRLQQFTRRYCVAVTGIEKQKDESPEKLREEVLGLVADVKSTTKEDDIDKFHRNGRVNGNEQEIIIRFKSHAAKEAFYRARKDLLPARKDVRIKPSLSLNQKNLLRDAETFVEKFGLKDEEVNPVEFVFANLHGEIQVKMKKKFRGSCFITFNSLKDLAQRLQDAQVVKDEEANFDEISTWADTDSNSPQVETPRSPPSSVPPRKDDNDDDMGFGLFV